MNMPRFVRISPKVKVILVLLLLNLLGFWAAQTYFSKQESRNSDKEMVEDEPSFGSNVEEPGVYQDWGTRFLSHFLGR
jgi:hypothetical protein